MSGHQCMQSGMPKRYLQWSTKFLCNSSEMGFPSSPGVLWWVGEMLTPLGCVVAKDPNEGTAKGEPQLWAKEKAPQNRNLHPHLKGGWNQISYEMKPEFPLRKVNCESMWDVSPVRAFREPENHLLCLSFLLYLLPTKSLPSHGQACDGGTQFR